MAVKCASVAIQSASIGNDFFVAWVVRFVEFIKGYDRWLYLWVSTIYSIIFFSNCVHPLCPTAPLLTRKWTRRVIRCLFRAVGQGGDFAFLSHILKCFQHFRRVSRSRPTAPAPPPPSLSIPDRLFIHEEMTPKPGVRFLISKRHRLHGAFAVLNAP